LKENAVFGKIVTKEDLFDRIYQLEKWEIWERASE
jgi:hypothetical protein